MKRSAGQSTARRVAQTLCILLLLAILCALLFSQVYRSASAVGREKIVTANFGVRRAYAAYLFREEQTVISSNNGPVEYRVAEGEAVAKGQELATVWTDSSATDRRAEAAALYDEIERLERAQDQSVAWQKGYMESYDAMMCALGAGNWSVGTAAAVQLGASLEQRSAASDASAVSERIAQLREQASELYLYEDAPNVEIASMSGYFTREADGYEALFGTAAADGLTPEKLRDLLAARVAPEPETVGKLVGNADFCLAVPTVAAEAEAFSAGSSYSVVFDNATVRMLLEEITYSADESEAVMVFSAERLPEGLSLDRRQTVEIEVSRVNALRVPQGAIEEESGEFAVYVLLDGVARRRRVKVLCTEGGCCLVEPQIDEEYLREGEFVLITLRNVYDGKVLYR